MMLMEINQAYDVYTALLTLNSEQVTLICENLVDHNPERADQIQHTLSNFFQDRLDR